MTASASPVAPVTARSPRLMMAAFSRDRRQRVAQVLHVIPVDVGDCRHATVPNVGGVQPTAKAYLDHGRRDPGSSEPRERGRRHELELGRIPEPPRNPVGCREHVLHDAHEVRRRDGRAVHHDPFAVAHQMRLGRLRDASAGGTQRGAHQRLHAPLAVRAAHERAADAELRVSEDAKQRPRAPETEPNSEPAACLKSGHGLGVGHVACCSIVSCR